MIHEHTQRMFDTVAELLNSGAVMYNRKQLQALIIEAGFKPGSIGTLIGALGCGGFTNETGMMIGIQRENGVLYYFRAFNAWESLARG